MPRPRSCTPPKTIRVKGYWRNAGAKKRAAKRAATKRRATLPYVVRDERTGGVISRHRSWSAAVKARKRADLSSYRAGRGRPYNVEKAA